MNNIFEIITLFAVIIIEIVQSVQTVQISITIDIYIYISFIYMYNWFAKNSFLSFSAKKSIHSVYNLQGEKKEIEKKVK